MSDTGPKSLPAIGFLTVLDSQQHGLFGGYLVLNTAGRPLEFHCTAPVKPNRAQEILYGPTLQPYLYGEQIGQTLLRKAKIKPLAVCTDVQAALAVRPLVSLPVLLILPPNVKLPPLAADPSAADPSQAEPSALWRLDQPDHQPPQPHLPNLIRFTLGPHQAAVAPEHESDRDLVLTQWQPTLGSLDLTEPFERIRQAIEEAQRG